MKEKRELQEVLDAESTESEIFEDTPEPSEKSEEEIDINEASNCQSGANLSNDEITIRKNSLQDVLDSPGELAVASKHCLLRSRSEPPSDNSDDENKPEGTIDLLTGKAEELFDVTLDLMPKGKLVGEIKDKLPLIAFMDKIATKIGQKIVQAKESYDNNKMNDPDNRSPDGSESSGQDKDIYDRPEDFVIKDLRDS